MGRFPVTYVLLVPRVAQARACLSTGARVTIVLMTFRVLAQGGGRGILVYPSTGVLYHYGGIIGHCRSNALDPSAFGITHKYQVVHQLQ